MTEMDELENINIGESPHGTINCSDGSRLSVDSGYLTLTPRSGADAGAGGDAYTPIISGCKSKKRHHRNRLDPLQSERGQRHRSKLHQLLNASESDYLVSESYEDPSSSLSDVTNKITECEQFRGRRRESWRTSATVLVTPASTRLQLLSPPPSPALPSSLLAASEPIEEDVEMKLVIVPQSTPQVNASPRRETPSSPLSSQSPPTCNIAVSPVISSVDNRKLSKLSITDLAAAAEIKPKRLNFSHSAISVALHRGRATPDYTGKESLDVLALLGDKSNHWRIVSKILSYLGPQDLCSISMVSKTWRRICVDDSRANTRRLMHVILRQNAKENLKLIKKSKLERDIQNSPKSRCVRKGYLLEVQNLLQAQQNRCPPGSPPVSPSKVKFHSFVKASRTLEPWEHLLPCPKCSFPCHIDNEKNLGTCSRQGCSIEFCSSCSSRPHTGPCKTPLLATPTKRNKRLIVGSRQSKRNLRRL